MPTWMTLAWINRERIYAAARKLKWPLRTWVAIAVVALLGAGVWWLWTHGNVRIAAPGTWPLAQWVLLVVNVVGFACLYLAMRVWYGRQDELMDDVDRLRSQVDELRVAVHEHEHDIEFAEGFEPEAHPDTVNAIPSARPLPPPPVPMERAATAQFGSVRAAPVSERELPTVERQLGGRTFTFRHEAEG